MLQVNEMDLAGIQGGEVATTNMHSCNGPEFVVQVQFSTTADSSTLAGQSKLTYLVIIKGLYSCYNIKSDNIRN